ncbi:cupin domain-containing protein [Brevibacillus laterosporus]|nr:cupin domain-containing protein [Brevibacillus laterosporus]MED2004056.1 cupin domain-containing protein [Brevibacillus laterosporus]MED4763273.1 cupin domain-containing protein [Brevibacillus laterosporus]TPH14746.1 cupin domain-containing protein [Brevibacillus laterosporus]
MKMYPRSSHHYQWHNPMHNNWNNNNWSYNWNPHYYNWNNNWNPYFRNIILKDYGPTPFVVNIDKATKQNNTYRTALWTGKHFQVTLMSINVGDDIGLEVHPTTDQFIRIEEGQGLVQMGDSKDKLDFQEMAYDDYAIMIPAGKWHNVTNTGNKQLKIYVIYAPPEHPYGTVHETKANAMAAERVR